MSVHIFFCQKRGGGGLKNSGQTAVSVGSVLFDHVRDVTSTVVDHVRDVTSTVFDHVCDVSSTMFDHVRDVTSTAIYCPSSFHYYFTTY